MVLIVCTWLLHLFSVLQDRKNQTMNKACLFVVLQALIAIVCICFQSGFKVYISKASDSLLSCPQYDFSKTNQ